MATRYDETLFIVAHSPSVVYIENVLELRLNELNILLMEKEQTILTFERNETCVTSTTWVADVRERLALNGDNFTKTLSLVLYLLIDKLTDNFFPVLEYYGEKIEEIESKFTNFVYQYTYSLFRGMLMIENRSHLIRVCPLDRLSIL